MRQVGEMSPLTVGKLTADDTPHQPVLSKVPLFRSQERRAYSRQRQSARNFSSYARQTHVPNVRSIAPHCYVNNASPKKTENRLQRFLGEGDIKAGHAAKGKGAALPFPDTTLEPGAPC